MYQKCGKEVLPEYLALMRVDFRLSGNAVNAEIVLEGKMRFNCVCRKQHLMKMPDDSDKTYEERWM